MKKTSSLSHYSFQVPVPRLMFDVHLAFFATITNRGDFFTLYAFNW